MYSEGDFFPFSAVFRPIQRLFMHNPHRSLDSISSGCKSRIIHRKPSSFDLRNDFKRQAPSAETNLQGRSAVIPHALNHLPLKSRL